MAMQKPDFKEFFGVV